MVETTRAFVKLKQNKAAVSAGGTKFNDNEETNQNKTTTKYETRRRNDLKSLVVATVGLWTANCGVFCGT